MGKSRTWCKYKFKIGNRVVHGGITSDLVRREREHKVTWPKGHIAKIGHCTAEEAARKWEKEQGFS